MAHILQRSLMQLLAPLIWAPSFIRWTEYDSSRFYCRCSCTQCFHENTDGNKGHQSGLLNQQLEAKQQCRASSLPGWCILFPRALTAPEMDFSESITRGVTYFCSHVLSWKAAVATAGAQRSHFLVTHKYLFLTRSEGRAYFLCG